MTGSLGDEEAPAQPASVRLGALDGLRGVAVTAVVVNHFRPGLLPGGWLGVDVFFVLSGYLITSLLLDEHRAHGRIDLRHFYSRRARRLLPALCVLLAVLVVVASQKPDAPGFHNLSGDGIAALGYFANWHFVLSGASYFDSFSPSPLRHLWSLSVEEQFYVLWPLLLIVIVRRFGTRGVGIAAVGLAAASAIAMAFFYGNGSDISRVYFGTDTHAHGVLIGAALAVIGPARRHWRFQSAAALFALGGVGVAFAMLGGTDAFAYRGGIVGVGLLTAMVIAGVVAPQGSGATGRLLDIGPVRGLGRISYGVYLWHWPVLVFMTATVVGLSGWALVSLQLGTTFALAIVSFLVIERPVLGGWPRMSRSWIAAPAVATVVVVMLTVVWQPAPPPYAVAQQQAAARDATSARLPTRLVARSRHTEGGAQAARVPKAVGPRRVLVVGDSVAYTLFPGLQANEREAGFYFLTAARTGCPLDIATTLYHSGAAPDFSMELPDYCDWPRVWPSMIDRTRPDLVVALWGLWDVYDHKVRGTWLEVGSPQWAAYMEQTLERALHIVTARGARMIVLTTPYVWGYDRERVDALNNIYRTVAARYPKRLSVIDMQPTISAIDPERWDNVHFSADGAKELGPFVVAAIAAAAEPAP